MREQLGQVSTLPRVGAVARQDGTMGHGEDEDRTGERWGATFSRADCEGRSNPVSRGEGRWGRQECKNEFGCEAVVGGRGWLNGRRLRLGADTMRR
jgi:hypothetical protein